RTNGLELAVGGWDAAHDHEASSQYSECSAQPGQRAGEEGGGRAGSSHRTRGCELDDRRASSLKVVTVVEVADENVAFRQRRARGKILRYEGNAIRINVAVIGNG